MQAQRSTNDDATTVRGFLELVRSQALDRLGALLGRSDLQVLEARDDAALEAFYWVSTILVAWPGARVTFKVYYKSRDAAGLLAARLGRQAADVTDAMGADFVREYCNVTAGAIKALVAGAGVGAGISLPVVMMGFDEFVVGVQSTRDESRERWLTAWSDGRFGCSAAVHVRDWAAFTPLVEALRAAAAAPAESVAGEVEFL